MHKMQWPTWLPIALLIQLVLVFFAPPITVHFLGGSKNLFLSDVWCILLMLSALGRVLRARSLVQGRNLLKAFAVSGALLVLIYLHGLIRPSIREIFAQSNFLFKEEDRFQALRELLICIRFLSWIWLAFFIAAWSKAMTKTQKLQYTRLSTLALSICTIIGFLSLLLDKVSPQYRHFLGIIYGYDPSYNYWLGRAYGVFSSPTESGSVFCLSFLLLYTAFQYSTEKNILSLAIAATLGSVFFTGSMTPFIALGITASLVFFLQRKKTWAYLVSAMIVMGLLLAAFPYIKMLLATRFLAEHSSSFAIKLDDLHTRAVQWSVYGKIMLSRMDLTILGLGFLPYHTDNSYVFLLSRGGLLTLLAFLLFLHNKVNPLLMQWSLKQISILVFFLVSGYAIDLFIFRHIVTIFITTAIPILCL